MKSNQYQIANVELWPNYFSLEENNRIKDNKILQLIADTKRKFFKANEAFFKESDLQPYLDPSRDIYYPPKDSEPSYCKAGLHYSIPDDAVGIGLKVDPYYQNDQIWAMLYHGTKGHNLMSIMKNGLQPGQGQAHQGSMDPWGQHIPRGVYFSFWMNQSFAYTIPNNPIIMECFVKDVYVAPGYKGYTVSNQSALSRILIPLTRNRNLLTY